MKILLYDCETSPNISYTWFGTHEVDVIEQVEEGHILSFAYKWLGEKTTKSYCLTDFKGNKEVQKKKLIEKLWDIFNEADVVVAHNATQFDIKWANRSFVLHGLTPPSPYKVVDTLTLARSKFKFNNNRLNSLGKYLGLGEKVDTGGFDLWKRGMSGDKKAFKLMSKYNRNDVVLLEKVYLRLRPYITTHPNMNLEYDECPMCKSKNIIKQGSHTLVGGYKKDQFQCNDCGRWFSGKSKYKI